VTSGAPLVTVEEATQVLTRTPVALRGLLAGLPEAWVSANEGPGTFSAKDVVGHLIFGEETDWIPRMRIILEHGPTRPFPPFDRFGFEARHGDLPLAARLDLFERLRQESLRALAAFSLTADDLKRPGRHPELGDVTLGQLLATWVAHDLNHLGQVARVMARRYTDEVGPWRAYLRILG
jgi:hypothetical protein